MTASSRRPGSICLSAIATAVLAVGLSSCCRDVPDETYTDSLSGMFTGADLTTIRDNNSTDETRCQAACVSLADDEGYEVDMVESCSAVGDVDAGNPWDTANATVTVDCDATHTEPGFCTGRRPQGHHELELAVDSRGTWFAVHAHLERASITAFVELAEWLERRGAPASLIERCRAAAVDEVAHAESMAELARHEGSTAPIPEADAPADTPLAVALQNAVEGCVHEAFAAIVAAHQAQTADPDLRDEFATIAADELRHGQLAWDLHAWLMQTLSETDRCRVVEAQRRALASLPNVVESNARATPCGLGWPTPERAADMARSFASLL